MATTYRAAFGNPHAHQPVLQSLRVANGKQPDTSCDAALAKALAEEEGTSGQDGPPVSPSGVKINVPHWECAERPGAAAGPLQGHRSRSDGGLQQLAAPQNQPARAPSVSDEELARQLQRVELAAHEDATGIRSLLFPELSQQPSNRELTLSRTLSRVPSIRVQPRALPSSAAPPPEPAVSADRQRLLATLSLYELVERQVAGDGNCQFRALSDQLYGTPDHHASVRSAVAATLRRRADVYAGYVPGEYGEYCAAMARPGTWGDHVTLQAAADTYGMKIVVVASFADSPVINIDPERQTSSRTLFLSFWAEVHYNSLYPKQEPPSAPAAAPSSGPAVPKEAKEAGGKPPKVLGSSRLGRLVHGAHGGKVR